MAAWLAPESARAHGSREPLPILASASDRSYESYRARGIFVCKPCQLLTKEGPDWYGGPPLWPAAL